MDVSGNLAQERFWVLGEIETCLVQKIAERRRRPVPSTHVEARDFALLEGVMDARDRRDRLCEMHMGKHFRMFRPEVLDLAFGKAPEQWEL